MDKNTITGFLLILLIVIGFSLLNKPSQQQMDAAREQKRLSDSIAMTTTVNQNALHQADSIKNTDGTKDSMSNTSNKQKIELGAFASVATGKDSLAKIENDLLELTMSSKGGRIASVRLKKFATYDSLPLILFDESESSFGFSFFSTESRLINTKDLYFKRIASNNPLQIIYRLEINDSSWLDYIYTLKKDDYRISFEIKGKNLGNVLMSNTNSLDFNWAIRMRQQEQGRTFEERYSGVNYKFVSDEVEKLSESKNDSKTIANKLKWVSFKDQFFASVVISDKGFTSNALSSKVEDKTSKYIKSYAMASTVDFDLHGSQSAKMQFYFGPIKHSLLKSYDKGIAKDQKLNLDEIVPLGGKLVRWANVGIIIPMFDFFGHFLHNYGIIILLMTISIKLILFPFTYKSYVSSAKMRVLNPQIQEINLKFPGNDRAAERSQATMELYKRAGVSPMGGCLPMLLQMPILFAMYSFFPSSIELRQQSFLWANDLSTYDAILTWSGNIPFVTKYFGNHLSLFCLLMTVTNIIYTHINMKTQPSTSTQMPGMKYMMYLMPVMFLFMFNQYSSGLSFYFFISTLITIAQTYGIRVTVNDKKLLERLNENKKKPVKKSGFSARLEQMQKDQQKMLKGQQKNKRS